jgi:hypothetical protein
MLDRQLGTADRPLALEVRPMRYRMLTVGWHLPLPDNTRIQDEEGTDAKTATPAKAPPPAPLATYRLPDQGLQPDAHTLLLGNFDGGVDMCGTLGDTKAGSRLKPVFGDGRFGQAFRAELDDEILAYSLANFAPGDEGTLEFWFKYLHPQPPQKPHRYPKLLGLKKSAAAAFYFNFYRAEDYAAYMVQPQFYMQAEADKTVPFSLGRDHLDFGTWNHVGIAWKQQTLRVFTNGKIISELKLPHGVANYFGPQLTIGSGFAGGGAVGCLFDDFRLSNVARYW